MSHVDEVTKKQLIYVKDLYGHGHEHASYGTELGRVIAIHHFDNAVELLLKCVATHFNISFRSLYVRFPDLWEKINQKYNLPKKTEMSQLHSLRGDIQHWGISPFSLEIVNRFDIYTEDFIRTVLKDVFNLNYDELFLSILIKEKEVREMLIEAEKAFGEENYEKTMEFAHAAFEFAKRKQEEKLGFYIPLYDIKDEKVRLVIEEIKDKFSLLALGIPYEGYLNFKKIAPHSYWSDGRISSPVPIFPVIIKKKYTRENALFCLNFVLECVQRWQI